MLVTVNGNGSRPAGRTNAESGTFSKESDIIRLNCTGGNSRSGMEEVIECGETEREAN